MSFLVAGGVCLLSWDHPDYLDVFPGGCCLSWRLLAITLMSFLVAAGGYPDVFPGGCW